MMTSPIDDQGSASDEQTKLVQDLRQLDIPAKYQLSKQDRLAKDDFNELYVGPVHVRTPLEFVFTFSPAPGAGDRNETK